VKKIIPDVVSVVLVNFRGVDDTIEAIKGLRDLDWPDHLLEIVVVENGSGDDSLARLRAIPGEIKVVASRKNLGFAGGCNLGVSKASGEFIAFLNNDARPDPGWLKEAILSFHTGRDVGAVASKVLDWEGKAVDFVDSAITWYGMGYKPHAGERDRTEWSREKDVLFGTGAAMVIRTRVFVELGGFDDAYFMFYEDVDLGWRLNLLGYRFVFQPKSLVYHKHHASIEKFGDFREHYLLERNALYTLFKNFDGESLAQVFPGALLLAARRAVARGSLDSAALDLRNVGHDAERGMVVDKSTMAGVFAIDQFVENLPELAQARAKIQSTRTVSDRQLKSKFGNTDEPAFPIDSYRKGYENIAESVGILEIKERCRVLVVTGDPIGVRMAGPAIRAWNIARVLSTENDVRLVSTTRASIVSDEFAIHVVPIRKPKAMAEHEEWADVIILQGHALQYFPSLETTAKVLIVDVYDPLHLEQLEQGRDKTLERWNDQVKDSTEALNHQLVLGDFFLCASERQRHFWLGQLAALGRVNAYTYSRDDELDSLIAVVPFGTPAEPPVAAHHAIKGVVPGIAKSDKVIIWGGGIYNWFDPETLIQAVGELAKRHKNVRLFFMGVKHPSAHVPEMSAVSRARAVAAQLDLGKHVFFNETWVPYEDRQNFLLDADLGVSTHFQHLETTFSFRTRILDYLWAGLPMVSTEGDSFADLIEKEGLGAIVPERDAGALAAALEELLFDHAAGAAARANVRRVRANFTWERVLTPLVEFCRNPIRAVDQPRVAGLAPKTATKLAATSSGKRSSNHSGVRRDVDRISYYMRNGGPSAVVERMRARLERQREARAQR
jgi:GT2 family glycosyltransferase/glycosyltransferase involved in cell wall biosynthesis